MKTIGFAGGSSPTGAGYIGGKESIYIYPKQIEKQGFQICNYSIGGANNYEIFLASSKLISESKCDIVVIEWNNFYRFRFYMSPETPLYISAQEIFPPKDYAHCMPLSKSDLKSFQRLLILTNHEYYSIIQLLEYCWILESMSKLNNTKLVMVNGYTPWTPDLFNQYNTETNLANELSVFAKELLDFDNRDDKDILKLLETLHNKFSLLDKSIWTNMFEPFYKFIVDYAPEDGQHPGPESHKHIAKIIIDNLTQREIL
jgi:hypothetical protein